MPVKKISLKTTDGKRITLQGDDVATRDVVEALSVPAESGVKAVEPRSVTRQLIDKAFGVDPDAPPLPEPTTAREAVDQIIEGVFAMSSGFCLDEPDERAALADVLAVDICAALPALAALLGKGK